MTLSLWLDPERGPEWGHRQRCKRTGTRPSGPGTDQLSHLQGFPVGSSLNPREVGADPEGRPRSHQGLRRRSRGSPDHQGRRGEHRVVGWAEDPHTAVLLAQSSMGLHLLNPPRAEPLSWHGHQAGLSGGGPSPVWLVARPDRQTGPHSGSSEEHGQGEQRRCQAIECASTRSISPHSITLEAPVLGPSLRAACVWSRCLRGWLCWRTDGWKYPPKFLK